MDSNRLPKRRSWMVGMTMPKTRTTGMRGICRMLRPYISPKLSSWPISGSSTRARLLGLAALAVVGGVVRRLHGLGLGEAGAGVLQEHVLQGRREDAGLLDLD